jgi:hypothetical protein
MKLKLWAAQFMENPDKSGTLEEALSDAKTFSPIAAQPWYYKQWAAQMLDANPKLTLGAYTNACFTWRKDLPEAAYAHGVSGNRVYALGWQTTCCVDPTHQAAQQFMIDQAVDSLKKSGYNALYLDVAGPAPLVPQYVSEVPIDPRTGQAWQWPAWNAGLRLMVGKIREAINQLNPNYTAFQNSLGCGPRYFDSAGTDLTIDLSVEGYEAELFVRDPEAPLTQSRSETAWNQDLAMLQAVEHIEGRYNLPMCKTWGTGTDAQRDAWMRLACASFLMGARTSRSRLCLTRQKGDNMTDHSQGISKINLGRALDRYRKIGLGYRRQFEGGVVIANPTKTGVTIDLGAACALPGEQPSSGSTLALGPYDGAVLRKASA